MEVLVVGLLSILFCPYETNHSLKTFHKIGIADRQTVPRDIFNLSIYQHIVDYMF